MICNCGQELPTELKNVFKHYQGCMPSVRSGYKCPFCIYSSLSTVSLRRHISNIHNQRRKERINTIKDRLKDSFWSCKQCPFRLDIQANTDENLDSSLNGIRTHAKSHGQPYFCPLCNYEFSNWEATTKHFYAHKTDYSFMKYINLKELILEESASDEEMECEEHNVVIEETEMESQSEEEKSECEESIESDIASNMENIYRTVVDFTLMLRSIYNVTEDNLNKIV